MKMMSLSFLPNADHNSSTSNHLCQLSLLPLIFVFVIFPNHNLSGSALLTVFFVHHPLLSTTRLPFSRSNALEKGESLIGGERTKSVRKQKG
ncbi:hypothetical protein I307_02342 [Cryptococcus deuterogattii 99/473]|uniref:Uncharacterized protein n=1 Tax=Cryptococcus deuterogattii Ram5 TaxID=1296110 RepID=A0A0D0SYN4_9TREE|nr:hypothetical protein I309_01983 [Cryptococcus deuterogattii LA55]KIR38327.1 hypothetical protein I313_05901 [Cryptococcus deuterogattii Ram5]KIR93024.1 hypothetical protein I304_02686 [Cryptococcus deuterogattii CBS 10090]KIR99712.1 hypothetical protein L804_03345 [Cryptococcus deuterogattii 2001/935-1]KIY58095.1 hypothetical protein I307_02342 [Cryptococcus deuterogattii 99/473]